jgi:hypothetical protein
MGKRREGMPRLDKEEAVWGARARAGKGSTTLVRASMPISFGAGNMLRGQPKWGRARRVILDGA